MKTQQWGVTILCAIMILGAGSLEAAKDAVWYETSGTTRSKGYFPVSNHSV